jgi:glycosyltransferase involved in cell wall biosynthesis
VLFLSKSNSISFFDVNSGYDIKYPQFNCSIYNPFLIFLILKHIRKYDIINVHLFPALYIVAFTKFLFSNKKILVFTEHSTNNRRMHNRFYKWIDQFVYKQYNKVVTISNDVDFAIKKHLGFRLEYFELIKNGIDFKIINKSKPYNKSQLCEQLLKTDFVVTQVSSFQYPKDQITLIDAIANLPTNIKCLLVGDGIERINCERYVKDRNLENKVFFLGKRIDVYEIMKTSDVLVLSSKYEGMPISCLESLFCNKPFIGTNVPGIREVVAGYGLLFDFLDSKQLSKHIFDLFIDPEYYSKISNSCLLRSKDFDISLTVKAYSKLYKSLNENAE